MEMASASGLPLVPEERRNPLYTTTYGTGELILHALEQGHRNFYLGIGGSATNDGGIGAMTALGIRFLNKNRNKLSGYGQDLEKITEIDVSGLNPLVRDARFTVMCDVTNPLLGENGATRVFVHKKEQKEKFWSVWKREWRFIQISWKRRGEKNPQYTGSRGSRRPWSSTVRLSECTDAVRD